jgi:hypothetical protein
MDSKVQHLLLKHLATSSQLMKIPHHLQMQDIMVPHILLQHLATFSQLVGKLGKVLHHLQMQDSKVQLVGHHHHHLLQLQM